MQIKISGFLAGMSHTIKLGGSINGGEQVASSIWHLAITKNTMKWLDVTGERERRSNHALWFGHSFYLLFWPSIWLLIKCYFYMFFVSQKSVLLIMRKGD